MNSLLTASKAVEFVLEVGVVIAFVVAVASLIAIIVRWRTPNRRRHAFRALVAFLAIPCLIGVHQAFQRLVFIPALARHRMAEISAALEQKQSKTSVVHPGDLAPQFNLTTVDGDEFSLPENGRVVVINFFATWCGPCRLELPHVERLWNEHKGNDHFRLLVVGREETAETVREFRDENGYTFPIAADPDREVYSLFATQSIPRTLVISPDGRIVYSKLGFYEEVMEELNDCVREELGNFK